MREEREGEIGEAGALEEKRIREERSRTGDEPGFGGGRARARVSNERKQIKSERPARVRILVGYKLPQ